MDTTLLTSALAQGEEQARQLGMQLEEPFINFELCKSLARNMQSSFETVISMARMTEAECSRKHLYSPQSESDSPQSKCSEQEFKDQEQRDMICKKRKSLPKWSSQVLMCLGGGFEGALDDGYAWRKYGRKDILGSKYPRGYYRCTHRKTQGCLATKQVQRSDSDPSIIDVSYRGIHTCAQKSPMDTQPSPKELSSMKQRLEVKTDGLDSANSSLFPFPSTPVNYMQPQSNILFSAPMHDNKFSGVFSPNFLSSTAPDSTYFTNPHNSESELEEILTALTSATNTTTLDVDSANQHVEFDPNFPFNFSNFF